MADTVGLTVGELDRLQIMTRIAERRLTRRKAAALLSLSERQVRRLYGRFTCSGAAGLAACSSRKQLHDHHIVFRSRGGDNARDNRITICAWHHLRGIHAGGVRATGEAPADITWELGVRAGRRPLLRLHGDRYVR